MRTIVKSERNKWLFRLNMRYSTAHPRTDSAFKILRNIARIAVDGDGIRPRFLAAIARLPCG